MTEETKVPEGEDTQLVKTGRTWGSEIQVRAGRIEFSNFLGIVDYAKMLAHSGMLRSYGIENWETAAHRIAMGVELGIGPNMALESIATIRGKNRPWGDLVPYLAEQQEGFLDREEWYERDGERLDRQPSGKIAEDDDTLTAVCRLTYRTRGGDVRTHEVGFSLADAKAAGLFPGTDRHGAFSKEAAWNTWTARMLMWRSRTFAVRDVFPGALKGSRTREESLDHLEPRETASEVVETRVEGEIGVDDVQASDEPARDERNEKGEADFDVFRADKTSVEDLGVILCPPEITEAKSPIMEADLLKAVDADPDVCVVLVQRDDSVRVFLGIKPSDDELIALISCVFTIGHFNGEGQPPHPVSPDALPWILPAEAELMDAEARGADIDEALAGPEQDDLDALTKDELKTRMKASAKVAGLFGAEAKSLYKALFPSTPPSMLSKPEMVRILRLIESGEWKSVPVERA